MKKTVIIAAAGSGNRLGKGIPKCLVKVGGRAIFEYQLAAFGWADEIRMVVGCKADEVIKQVSAVNKNVVFIHNDDYSNTTTLQSNFLGAQGVEGAALFVDGDMILSRDTSELLRREYELGEPFIGVASDISEEPVYAGVEDGKVRWFSYEKPSGHEWANAALLDTGALEYNKTHFFVQLEKFLPTKAVVIERLEVDTSEDLAAAEKTITEQDEKYNFWR